MSFNAASGTFNEADTSLNDVSLRVGESMPDDVIYNQAEIPDEFAIVSRCINKEEVKQRLLKGEVIPGATLSTQKTLEIIAQDPSINKLRPLL